MSRGETFTVTSRLTGTVTDHLVLAGRAERYVVGHLRSSVFQQLVSAFEDFVFDLLRLWLADHPGSLYRRQVDLETVLNAPDTAAVLHAVKDRELNELKYKRVADWFAYLGKLVPVSRPTPDQIQGLTEAKASRDLLMHNKGAVNATYRAKAGPRARHQIGELLELPDQYFRDTATLVKQVIDEVIREVAAKA